MASLDLNDVNHLDNSNETEDEEQSSKTIVSLHFKSMTPDSPSQIYHLKTGSNIIGRGEPHFLNNIKISRRHAEITVSAEIGNVTFNQLGQNHSTLFRSGEPPKKLVRGISNQLLNEDSVSLYDGSIPFSIHIEKDNQYMSVCERDSSFLLTQEANDEHSIQQHIPQSIHRYNNDAPPHTESKTIMYNNNNHNNHNNNSILTKREREEDIEDDENVTKKINNDNNKNNILLTLKQQEELILQQQLHQHQQLQLQQQQLKQLQEQQTQLKLQQIKKHKKENTPVLVEDALKLNIQENELIFVKKIGSGACGEVSQHEWKGTPVAVKTIFKSLLRKDKKEEFDKEVAILKCLRHPNVVLFMGTCLLNGNLSIITEYLNRGSLRDVLQSMNPNELSLPIKIKMLIDVAQGMNYLHTYSPPIIHRDLKSLNLLVDNNFNVKVSDFGLSRFISNTGALSKTFCGTLSWIAPEVFNGFGYTTKVDVFSFGVVLWEILTHKQPSGNISASALGHPDLEKLPYCPSFFAELIKECCNKNPEDRPNFSQILSKLKFIYSQLPNSNSNGSYGSNNSSANNSGGSGGGGNNYSTLNQQQNANNETIKEYTIQPNEITNIKTVVVKDNHSILEGIYKGKLVSIKQIKGNIDEFEIKQLSVLASIKSPLAVQFIGVVFNTDEYAIINEHVGNKGSLLSLMQQFPKNLNWSNTIDLAIQISQSIQYLHKHQPPILHRNITSDCFLLVPININQNENSNNNNNNNNNNEQDQLSIENLKIKVHNFGESRFNIKENQESLKEIKGNFLYAPPELLSIKDNAYTNKSDIYSLSIVFYELFETCLNKVYKKPFHDVSLDFDFQIIHKTSKLNLRPTISKEMPNEISKILQQSWLSDSVLRPSLDTIIKDLQNCKKILCSK